MRTKFQAESGIKPSFSAVDFYGDDRPVVVPIVVDVVCFFLKWLQLIDTYCIVQVVEGHVVVVYRAQESELGCIEVELGVLEPGI